MNTKLMLIKKLLLVSLPMVVTGLLAGASAGGLYYCFEYDGLTICLPLARGG